MDLQTVLYENKIKMRKEFIKKAKLEAKKRRKEKIQERIIVIFLILLACVGLNYLNTITNKDFDKCVSTQGYSYCINELG